jgi:hypothetical protein
MEEEENYTLICGALEGMVLKWEIYTLLPNE